MIKIRLSLPVILILLAQPSHGNAEDLLDTFRLAAQSDPQLQAAAAARLAVLEIGPQSRALLFPSLDFSATASTVRQDIEAPSQTPGVTGFSGDDRFNDSGYTLSLVQPLYNQATFALLRQADARIGQANAEVAAAEQNLLVSVSERYFNVLAALDNLEFARAEMTAIARQLEQSRQRFEVGLTARTEVDEAQAFFDLALADEIAAQNQVAISREALAEVTGRFPEDLAPLIGNLPLASPEPADIDQWTDTALEQNLGIIAADFVAQAAREEIDRQRAARYPRVDIVGIHSDFDTGGGRFGGVETETTSIGLQLNANIFDGGLISSRTREAQFLHVQARQLLEAEQRAVLRQTRASYLGVLATISRVNALEQAVVSSRSALEATEAGLEVGIRNAVDVLDAQREMFRALSELARVRYDYILETLSLKQAAGILGEADLQQINTLLKGSLQTLQPNIASIRGTLPMTDSDLPAQGTRQPSEEGWVVQLATFFKDGPNATGLRDRLQNQGYTVFLEEASRPDGTLLLQVRVGPLPERSHAQALRDELEKETSLAGIVVRHSPSTQP